MAPARPEDVRAVGRHALTAMAQALSRLAAVTALLLYLVPPLWAQAPSDRVIAIVRLRTPAAAFVEPDPPAPPAATAANAAEAAFRDQARAIADERRMAQLESLTRASRDRLARDIRRRGGRIVYSLSSVNAVVADLPVTDLAALQARPDVASVTVDEPRMAHIEITAQALSVPTLWNAGYTGGAVDVAVIDTGLYVGHSAFVTRSSSIISGVFHDAAQSMANYWDIPTDPDDYAGHGTKVSGVVFSQGTALFPDRRGLAPGLDRLYNIKAGYLTYPSGGSSLLSDLMAGVDWALTRDDPPEVFNYSYGARVSTDDDAYTQFWDGVVDTFGKTATISAGNSGAGAVGSPGMAYNVLSVANVNHLGTATRADDVIATSSSGGPTPGGRKKPDLAAPGTNLIMPSHYGPELWSRATGTSFSAPAVAGVAALLIDAGVADPRAVKALLINSADPVPPEGGWDPRFGWGYVNSGRAFAERGAVTMTAVGGSAPRVRLFERAAAAPTKATAAWHRHVDYETGGWPDASVLGNVDLFLYARNTGALRASSTSAIDNVEQVATPVAEAAVLAVRATALSSSASEPVALAHSGGFVARTGPDVSVSVAGSTVVPPGATFTVTATVANSGDLRGHAFEATLSLPQGYELVQGTVAQGLGSIDAGAAATVAWVVRAPLSRAAPSSLSVRARTQAYGIEREANATGDLSASEGCTYTLSESSLRLPAEGGTAQITVSAPVDCGWAAAGGDAWITVVPSGGIGPGAAAVQAAANHGVDRKTTITVAGHPVTVSQSAFPTRSYYLAEGTTGGAFTLEVAIANPNQAAADVRLSFLRPNEPPVEQLRTVAAQSRITIRVDDVPGLESSDVSTVVESLTGLPLAVERTMAWGETAYGGHGGTAVDSPSTSWYFAEGFQGFFDTYLLLANPGSEAAAATVTYLREQATPVVRTYRVNARSRRTVYAGDDPELVDHAFAIVVRSDVPVVAERSMYWSSAEVFWTGGHESAGVPSPSTAWLLAEGATGPYFDEYVLIGNPGTVDAEVTVQWMLPSGETIETTRTVPAERRVTIEVAREDVRLSDTAVSARVTASQPVVVERAMYWPGTPEQWQEAHGAFGLTETGLCWALAEGRVGTPAGYETYFLLANPASEEARVRVLLLRESGPPVEKAVVVAPHSRTNFVVVADARVSQAPELADERFGAFFEVTSGASIVVERAMYWNSGGRTWAAGTSAVGVIVRE